MTTQPVSHWKPGHRKPGKNLLEISQVKVKSNVQVHVINLYNRKETEAMWKMHWLYYH